MYSRFIRWASDRLAPDGVIAFVTNSSFIDKKTYDGFRKVITDEFNEIYAINMKGDARTSGERRRQEGGNVFSDQIRVGVAILFLVKNQETKGCKIYYNCVDDYLKAEVKKAYLRDNKFEKLPFAHIQPDKHHNWINLAENEWDDLIPVATRETKLTKKAKEEQAIFKLYANGVVTARDEWVYDLEADRLAEKTKFIISTFNNEIKRYQTELLKTSTAKPSVDDFVDYQIKWSAGLKENLVAGRTIESNKSKITLSSYRPFVTKYYYFEPLLSDRLTQNHFDIFGTSANKSNIVICFSGLSSSKPFQCLVSSRVPSFDLLEKTQCLPLYRYDEKGNRYDNITDWALVQFREHYKDSGVTRESIFHYVYAVLHNPAYRDKYAINLKREFPHIPFYDDFWKWSALGKQLLDLCLNYETAPSYSLKRVDTKSKAGKPPVTPIAKLKADKQAGTIKLDSITTLKGIPKVAWEYKLGNRSVLEWVLEYHKERKPKDPTILKKFNTYHFADHKEQVIDLLQRVCTVSVETMKIIKEMESLSS